MLFIKALIQILFWLQAFLAPVIVMALIALAVGKDKLVIPLLVMGGLAGVILAEYIRRRYGLSTFFARIYGPNAMDEQPKKKEQ